MAAAPRKRAHRTRPTGRLTPHLPRWPGMERGIRRGRAHWGAHARQRTRCLGRPRCGRRRCARDLEHREGPA